MPQNNDPPRHLQGGPSFTYGERGNRKRPADIDEIIHFVRTQGITRESTEMRLTRKAPLPGIGQAQMSHRRRRSNDNQNSSSLDTDNTEGTDEAYEFDADFLDYPETHRTVSPSAYQNPINNLLSLSQTNILSKSMEASQFNGQPRAPLKPLGGQQRNKRGGVADHSPSRNRRAVRHLPPVMKRERSYLQMALRPTAPSPSVTPPLSSSDVMEEDTEDFIET